VGDFGPGLSGWDFGKPTQRCVTLFVYVTLFVRKDPEQKNTDTSAAGFCLQNAQQHAVRAA
jgi:hypothetical protein